MIEEIYKFESSRVRQRQAPLFEEREQYLSHILEQGTSKTHARLVGSMLLHIIRVMQLDSMRRVDVEEVREAANRWLTDPWPVKLRNGSQKSTSTFTYLALKWLTFHDQLNIAVEPKGPYDLILDQFVHFLTFTRGLASQTIDGYTSRVSLFLRWVSVRHENFSEVGINDVDDFFEARRNLGASPRTIVSFCNALRLFFRYSETRGWNTFKVAPAISKPRICRYNGAPKGPAWKDVRRLLDHSFGTSAVELRAAAILSLCSIYALRRSEVASLKLIDFDWFSETFTVKRAKSGRIQQFPLQFEVGETILQYLQRGRPRCSCRNLFISLKPPYRPLLPTTVWCVIANRIKSLGIASDRFGPHALRHACATELLRKGSSLRDIADFLGHRDMASVSIYAKYDIRTLKQVAAFGLAGVK
jgi:integrase/recombinase XerD